MKNLPKEKRDRILLVAIATVTVLAGLWYGLISRQKAKLGNMAKVAAEQRENLERQKRMVSNAGQVRQNLENLGAKLRTVESGMVTGDMYAWIISTVNGFLDTRKYLAERPQFSRENPMEVGMFPKYPYKAVNFTLRGSAYFHDFGKFVAEFENTFPFIRIQNIDLESHFQVQNQAASATSTNDQRLTFKMDVVALVNPAGR